MKAVKFFFALALLGIATNLNAQITKEQQKERREIYKASREALEKKVSKDTKKEAKALKKQGWLVAPGALPIEKQLQRSYELQYQYDELDFPKYIMADGQSIGETTDAAKIQAIEVAKIYLAGQIQTEITALVESSVANKQLSEEEAASVTNTLLASKSLISQSIGRVVPVTEVYRVLPNKNKEVLVRIAYNSDMAKAAAKKAIRDQLENATDDLHDKLDKILGW